MYRHEADFVAALLPHLRKHGMVQRIESPETGVGIPDIWFGTRDREYWLEAKNMPRDSVVKLEFVVPYRMGQQAWAAKYYAATHRYCFTIAALRDGFLLVPNYKVYPAAVKGKPAARVPRTDCVLMTALEDVWTAIKLRS